MKILVGYDGSNSGKEALNLAKNHALALKGEVEVITSMQKEIKRKHIPTKAWKQDKESPL